MASRLVGIAALLLLLLLLPPPLQQEDQKQHAINQEVETVSQGCQEKKEEGRATRRLGGKHLSYGGDTSRCVSLPQGPFKKWGGGRRGARPKC